MTAPQRAVTLANTEFWNELCGTHDARRLGIVDDSADSLKRFDDWYFSFYPYLDRYLPPAVFAGKRVLEIGLGYGSVAQRLATSGAVYHGLDVAVGPVAMVRHRLDLAGLPGEVRQGDALNCPFADGSFERVVALGCFHHTGNLRRALAEAHRVLVPGGTAIVMVYNAYSYRRWARWPVRTARYLLWNRFGVGGRPRVQARERAVYDSNRTGADAPETVFISQRELRSMVADWSRAEFRRENMGGELFLRLVDRRRLLSWFGPIVGLDLYLRLTK